MKSKWMYGAAATMAAAILTGCPSASVHTDYDHNVNFSQFHSFSFGPVETDNPLYQQRIKDEVAKDLESKGLRRAEGTGDLVVTAVGATHNRKEYQTFYNGPGFGYYYYGFGLGAPTTTTVVHYKVGTLVVDMYNPANKHLVWRGTIQRGINDNPEANREHLNGAIDRMLSGFPPA